MAVQARIVFAAGKVVPEVEDVCLTLQTTRFDCFSQVFLELRFELV